MTKIENIPVVDFINLLDVPISYSGQAGYLVVVNPSADGLIFSAAIPPGGISLTQNHILVGNASNIATDVAMSGEASIISSGAVTLSNAAVISKVLTGYVSGSGVISSSDSILQAIQKLNGNIGALIAGVSSVSAISPITSSGGATPVISTLINTNKLIGRGTAGTGVMEEISISNAFSLSALTLNLILVDGGTW